jgi:hypothetical protein
MGARQTAALIFLPLAAATLISCDYCYWNGYMNITSYVVNPTTMTEGGIRVDDPEEQLDLDELDRQTDSLEECLGMTIERDCLTVKVAPDWYISECSGQELFPCEMPDSVCLSPDKGLTEEDLERCPCNCRAIIQDETTVIVTPNLLLYRGELARMVTGENNPWPNYSSCLLD